MTSVTGGSSPVQPLAARDLEALGGTLRGNVLAPGESSYEDARTVWNGMIDRYPAAIAQCLGIADVIQCVNFARERGIPLCIKGGGHNIAGLAVADGGLVLDLSPMRGVWVDPEERSAKAQAGCLLGDVDRETQVHGLAAVLGFVSNTGIAGLTLGGGFGYLTRRYGWTCDNLNSIDVVTAGGKLVRASESENPELFWGLRGGGGNFGVAVGFDYKLYPVGPEIMAGAIAWRAEEAPEVLELYRRIQQEASHDLAIIAALRKAPPAPWIQPDVHGKPIVAFFVCHTGSIEQGEKDLARIKNFGTPVGDVITRRPYAQQQALIDATQPKGRRYYWKSDYVGGVSEQLCERLIANAEKNESPHSAILLFPLDGALNELPIDHSAVGNRDTRAVLNIAGAWNDAAEDEKHKKWVKETFDDVQQFSSGGTYVNFLPEDDGSERTEQAYRDNYQRLVELKRKWDPDNLFRINKNIRP